ncbi:gp68, hypothetical protein [Burkholderia phage phi644-2]|uniref:Uncharacterized protein n=1 Tax=Burkholderia phage phi644-2 TaxID=2881400 RepID=A4JX63_9CAUD|nr:gp68, hypothetical protein [Burkholderia phage phi644-2]ABO60856.1 gp68, hypothetical protein [Burkholderia phage phi644-2]
MSLVSSICVMQSHERDDRHSRTHPVRTTAKHQNSHISSGRGNEKAREAFTLRASYSIDAPLPVGEVARLCGIGHLRSMIHSSRLVYKRFFESVRI